mgnify:CR=1 FL=1
MRTLTLALILVTAALMMFADESLGDAIAGPGSAMIEIRAIDPGQVLNANGRFAGYMWAPALANIVAVIGLVWFRQAGYETGAAPADWTPEMIAILAGCGDREYSEQEQPDQYK